MFASELFLYGTVATACAYTLLRKHALDTRSTSGLMLHQFSKHLYRLNQAIHFDFWALKKAEAVFHRAFAGRTTVALQACHDDSLRSQNESSCFRGDE
jgi:hypothetical protein